MNAAAADRTCAKCGLRFAKPCHLRRHLRNQKKPCDLIVDRTALTAEQQADPRLDDKLCRYCGRVFSSKGTRDRHQNKACKIAPNARNGPGGGVVRIADHLRQKEIEQRALQEEVRQIRQALVTVMPAAEALLVPATAGAARAGV